VATDPLLIRTKKALPNAEPPDMDVLRPMTLILTTPNLSGWTSWLAFVTDLIDRCPSFAPASTGRAAGGCTHDRAARSGLVEGEQVLRRLARNIATSGRRTAPGCVMIQEALMMVVHPRRGAETIPTPRSAMLVCAARLHLLPPLPKLRIPAEPGSKSNTVPRKTWTGRFARTTTPGCGR
jgi:hypothetical protein